LHQRLPDQLSFHPRYYCVEPYSREPGFGCDESELRPVLAPSDVRGGRVPSCLLVGVPPSGRTVVTYRVSGQPNTIKGRMENTGEGSGVSGTLSVDGGEAIALELDTHFRGSVPAGAARAVITLENSSSAASRVCLEAVLIRGN
jgi:hypothetical protein